MSQILTYTGKHVDLAAPNPVMIDPRDISHALSHQCRFNGHCREFYSVAQHSVLVAYLLPPELKLAGLLHDAPEAFLGDVVQPLKALMKHHHSNISRAWMLAAEGVTDPFELQDRAKLVRLIPSDSSHAIDFSLHQSLYHQAEKALHLAICERFGIDPEQGREEIHRADMVALATEKRDLMPHDPERWECLDGVEPHPARITPWGPTEARANFHHELMQQLQIEHRRRAAQYQATPAMLWLKRGLSDATSTGLPEGRSASAQEVQP